MAENGVDGEVIGVALDGTGYGTDGHIWGGEFLLADCRRFRRLGHLKYVPLPGGEAAIKRPYRTAVSHLLSAFGEETPFFADQAWYVAAYGGGTSSAQVFEAGGYRFLHVALEMQAGDEVLTWARQVIARHPGLPNRRGTI